MRSSCALVSLLLLCVGRLTSAQTADSSESLALDPKDTCPAANKREQALNAEVTQHPHTPIVNANRAFRGDPAQLAYFCEMTTGQLIRRQIFMRFEDASAAEAAFNRQVSALVVGHSAGGHLALWASVRDRLPEHSPLRNTDALAPGAVISLAGIADLKSFGRFVPLLFGPGIIERLVPERASPDPYADISPAQLPPPPGRVVMVSGILDRLVPPYVADDYARLMRRTHSRAVALIEVPGAGHFDLVTPRTPAWQEVEARIVEALSGS